MWKFQQTKFQQTKSNFWTNMFSISERQYINSRYILGAHGLASGIPENNW